MDWTGRKHPSESRKGRREWLNFALPRYYFGEAMAKCPQISEKDLYKGYNIKYLLTE